jgi:hypothetical protein
MRLEEEALEKFEPILNGPLVIKGDSGDIKNPKRLIMTNTFPNCFIRQS